MWGGQRRRAAAGAAPLLHTPSGAASAAHITAAWVSSVAHSRRSRNTTSKKEVGAAATPPPMQQLWWCRRRLPPTAGGHCCKPAAAAASQQSTPLRPVNSPQLLRSPLAVVVWAPFLPTLRFFIRISSSRSTITIPPRLSRGKRPSLSLLLPQQVLCMYMWVLRRRGRIHRRPATEEGITILTVLRRPNCRRNIAIGTPPPLLTC